MQSPFNTCASFDKPESSVDQQVFGTVLSVLAIPTTAAGIFCYIAAVHVHKRLDGMGLAMTHLRAIRSRLGKAARLGGLKRLMREATSDEFAAVFMHGLNEETRARALETFQRVAAKCQASPSPLMAKTGKLHDRVKIRWTDEAIERLRRHAPHIKSNRALALTLGYPEYCYDAVRLARRRFVSAASATLRGSKKPLGAPVASAFPRAA